MSTDSDIVCVGDIIVECIVRQPSLPPADVTVILDYVHQEMGGPAFNICWYLSHFGRHPRLVGPFGRHNQVLVDKTLSSAQLEKIGLVPIEGDSDFLVSVLTEYHHHSIYLRSTLPDTITTEIYSRCNKSRCLILTGSRHSLIRKTLIKLVNTFQGEFLAFNPSYAIYEYEKNELAYLLSKANVTIMNKQEAEHACQLLSTRNIDQLFKHMVVGSLIVTLGAEGVHIYYKEGILRKNKICSFATVTSTNAIGAGDALFAGFLHEMLNGKSLSDAAQFGSVMAAYVVESSQIRVHISEHQVRQRLNSGRYSQVVEMLI
ncbi:MAG: carbohydrate kinase family protein [Nostoc sp.]|uniref:carbohydrate kinase family protein n=1 Tax=Nostoc sp. TaxID=1180 RepID=UPI002FF57BD2